MIWKQLTHTSPERALERLVAVRLGELDGPGAAARLVLDELDLPVDVVRRHAPAYRALWIDVPGDELPLLDRTKWVDPFRFLHEQHLLCAAADAARAVGESLRRPLTVVVDGLEHADDVSLHFLAALLRAGSVRLLAGAADAESFVRLLARARDADCEDAPAPAPDLRFRTEDDVPETTSDATRRRRHLKNAIASARASGARELLAAALHEAALAYATGAAYDLAEACALEGLALVDADDRAFELARVLYLAAACRRDDTATHVAAARLLAVARATGDAFREAQARLCLATALLRNARPPRTAEALAEVDAILTLEASFAGRPDRSVLLLRAYVRNTRALAQFRDGLLDEARAGCEEATAMLEPFDDDPRVRVQEATIVYNLSQLELANRDLDGALRRLDRCLELEPDFPDYLVERANYLVRGGRVDEAVRAYDEAGAVGVPTPEYLLSMAHARRLAGDVEGALAVLARVRGSFPEQPDGFLAAATLHVERGELDEADAVLAAAELWHAGDARVACTRGLAADERGDDAGAEDAYLRALELDPACKEAWIDYAVLHYRRGELERARTCLDRALELDPDDPIALANRAFLDERTPVGAEAGQ